MNSIPCIWCGRVVRVKDPDYLFHIDKCIRRKENKRTRIRTKGLHK